MNIRKKTGRFFFVNSWDYNFKATVYNSYFESNQRQKPCKLLEIHWLTDLGGRVLGSYFQICHSRIHPGKLTAWTPSHWGLKSRWFSGFKGGSVFQFSGDSTVVQRNLFTQPGVFFAKPNLQLCGLLTFGITLPKCRIPRGTIWFVFQAPVFGGPSSC